VQRVYNTIDGELTKLEKQKGLTSQDRERASRALSQMVNALEKAVEMQREMTKTRASGGGAKSRESLAHAEDLRREIAERLERLNRKRTVARSSE
jgi:cellobiose-specific phosphotransferase system component IIA